MKTVETREYKVPEYAISALINADYSDLEDEEIKEVDKFQESLERTKIDYDAEIYTFDIPEDESYFSYNNDFNHMGSNVVDLKVHYLK